MKKSVKAALWSGFAFPGAGHFYLKQYLRGVIFLAVTLLSIVLIVQDLIARGLVTQTNALVDKIMTGVISPDLNSAEGLLNLGPETWISTIAPWVIVICWVAGIVDSYRLGQQQDKGRGI
jgi:TM2 domain-containing membrane protein YozV